MFFRFRFPIGKRCSFSFGCGRVAEMIERIKAWFSYH